MVVLLEAVPNYYIVCQVFIGESDTLFHSLIVVTRSYYVDKLGLFVFVILQNPPTPSREKSCMSP